MLYIDWQPSIEFAVPNSIDELKAKLEEIFPGNK